MKKLDLKKQYKQFYLPTAGKVSLVEVPSLQFAMIDGQLEPGILPGDSESFQQAVGALYGVSYGLKFMSKLRKNDPIDYSVMALEGLWSVEGGEFDIEAEDPWLWTAMIMQPDHITAEMFQQATAEQMKKRENPAFLKLRLERFDEGLCMQIMHIGPYADEPRTLAKMKAFAAENGYQSRGHHHEIYIGDPRRAKPERLKTVLRQPLEKISQAQKL